MERHDLATLAGFFSETRLAPGTSVRLAEDAAHHMRVRRLATGERVFLADGVGTRAFGVITSIGKRDAHVDVQEVEHEDRAPAVHLLVPVADRDRMLWCAEKCAELEATSWRPVRWRRSASVSPRGEGAAFATRARARMTAAILQSRSAWLPDLVPDAGPDDAIAGVPVGTRIVLDVGGEPIAGVHLVAPVVIAIGPEGGFEADELARLDGASFRRVSLGANVLRFETAAVAALAITRSFMAPAPETSDG